MATLDFVDALIEHLEDRQLQGAGLVAISKKNRSFLRESVRQQRKQAAPPEVRASRPPQPSAPPQPSQPQVSEPPQAPPPLVRQFQQAPPPQQAPAQGAPSPPMPDLSNMGWETLEQVAQSCTRCKLCQGRTNVVFGAGDRNADLMFIGEGPGFDEDQQGIPFVGQAGQLLTKIIGAMQLTRDQVYIGNIVKCRPPRNRNPEEDEAHTCLPILRRQIELVNPKVIVLLGAIPLNFLLQIRGITRNRGKWLKYGNIDVMPTYHPAFLTRKPEKKRDVWEDMKQVMAKLNIPMPPANSSNNRR